MVRPKVLTFALALTTAVPAEAETGVQANPDVPLSAIRFSAEGPKKHERQSFSFPIIEYVDQNGVRQHRKGIIASRVIAPDTVVGVGFFETTPKTHGYWGDLPPNVAPRRTKRAASVGLNWRF
jgi:hypothetical protein